MYSFPSPPRGKPIHILTVSCYAAAIIFLAVSGTEGLPYPFIYQIAAIVTAAAGVYLTTRYVLKQYTFALEESTITDANGRPTVDLTITEITGKKITTVARVGTRDIAAITVIHEKDPLAKQQKNSICQGKQVFRYLNTPFFSSACYIDLPDEHSVLVIPPDEQLITYLRSLS